MSQKNMMKNPLENGPKNTKKIYEFIETQRPSFVHVLPL
jgi:hypothetical protein